MSVFMVAKLKRVVISQLHIPELSMVIESGGGSNDLPRVTCTEMPSEPKFNQSLTPASVVLLTVPHFLSEIPVLSKEARTYAFSSVV